MRLYPIWPSKSIRCPGFDGAVWRRMREKRKDSRAIRRINGIARVRFRSTLRLGRAIGPFAHSLEAFGLRRFADLS